MEGSPLPARRLQPQRLSRRRRRRRSVSLVAAVAVSFCNNLQ